ncbi:hypothetical protein ACHAXA_001323, partial [Cyclostephanos tholiformis]
THLTSHDDIISKSFHGRRGRAYLLDQCVNVITGPPEERMLMTGLHTVSDISCKRCGTLVGWTYARAHDASQRYKEGKFIIERVNLRLEDGDDAYADIDRPAGEWGDRWWRTRSPSWGSGGGDERSASVGSYGEVLTSSSSSYHHHPSSPRTPVRRGPGDGAAITTAYSPTSPGDIIHEYPICPATILSIISGDLVPSPVVPSPRLAFSAYISLSASMTSAGTSLAFRYLGDAATTCIASLLAAALAAAIPSSSSSSSAAVASTIGTNSTTDAALPQVDVGEDLPWT